MTNEELQTLIRNACKAAGWPIKKTLYASVVSVWINGSPYVVKLADDDGDSRALQVACKIALHFEVLGGVDVAEAYSQKDEDMVSLCACEPLGTEPLKAARLAILSCAGYMVVGGQHAVGLYIDVDGRADITGWTKSDNNCPVIFIGNTCADTDTIAEFPEFPGWRVHATNGGKSLAVALVREGAEE